MNEYEVIIEEINPCGGETYARKEIIEVEAESPESYGAPTRASRSLRSTSRATEPRL